VCLPLLTGALVSCPCPLFSRGQRRHATGPSSATPPSTCGHHAPRTPRTAHCTHRRSPSPPPIPWPRTPLPPHPSTVVRRAQGRLDGVHVGPTVLQGPRPLPGVVPVPGAARYPEPAPRGRRSQARGRVPRGGLPTPAHAPEGGGVRQASQRFHHPPTVPPHPCVRARAHVGPRDMGQATLHGREGCSLPGESRAWRVCARRKGGGEHFPLLS
jgi:hypothetical protein